jgi:hypothetical protein
MSDVRRSVLPARREANVLQMFPLRQCGETGRTSATAKDYEVLEVKQEEAAA